MGIKNPQNLKKALAIVSTSTLLAAFGTPSVVPVLKPAVVQAAGAKVDTVTNVPLVQEGEGRADLATIRITFSGGTKFTVNDGVIVDLPTGFRIDSDSVIDVTYGGQFERGIFDVEQVGPDRIKIAVNEDYTLNGDGYLYIELKEIKVQNPDQGPVDAELIPIIPASVFPEGKVTVGRVIGDGEVQISVVDDVTSNNLFPVVVRVKEAVKGALKKTDSSLKFTLPDGFKWKGVWVDSDNDGEYTATTDAVYGDGETVTLTAVSGDNMKFTVHIDDDELELEPENTTSRASIWEIGLLFEVDDESRAKQGDVVIRVSGDSNVNVSELVAGKYGDYGAEVSVSEVKTLFAGQDDQKLGDITIKEVIPESFVSDRTITLTLPEGARWQAVYDRDLSKKSWNSEEKTGVEFDYAYTGPDKRTLKLTLNRTGGSKTEAKIKLKDLKIAVAPDFTGALEIELGGSAGVTGKLKVADVVSPIDVKVENLRDVIIGQTNQQAGDLVITEKAAGVLDDDDTDKLVVVLPEGVTFAKLPKVEVTKGDLRLGTVKLAEGDRELHINVDNKSTQASTIRISDVALKIDRTVAEGAVNVKIRGSAVMTTNAYSDWDGIDNIAKVAIANVVTPAPDAQKATVVFTVDNTKYTVNGVEKTADVAPYIKDGRTFLPVRYVAEALGVSSDNILWDAGTKTVTLFKGDRVVKLKIGSKVLYVNGTAINMDVAPEIKNGRTMLPIRWVGTALGVTVEWDEEARTVTVKQ